VSSGLPCRTELKPVLLATIRERGRAARRGPGAGERGDQHLLGRAPDRGAAVPGLRHRQGRPVSLHPAGRGRPGAKDPGQRAIAVGAAATSALDIVLTDDALRRQMEQATPLRRIGAPWEVAATVVFPASPASGYITGKILEVDGGIERPNLDLGIPDLR